MVRPRPSILVLGAVLASAAWGCVAVERAESSADAGGDPEPSPDGAAGTETDGAEPSPAPEPSPVPTAEADTGAGQDASDAVRGEDVDAGDAVPSPEPGPSPDPTPAPDAAGDPEPSPGPAPDAPGAEPDAEPDSSPVPEPAPPAGCLAEDDPDGSCDDGKPCTLDQCLETGKCSHAFALGLPCDDGDPCTGGDECKASGCKGEPDVDEYEKNDTILTAADLGGEVPGGLEATLFPEGDVDHYKVSIPFDPLSAGETPWAQAAGHPEGQEVRLCAYWKCNVPSEVGCTKGEPDSLGGIDGCCLASDSGSQAVELSGVCTAASSLVLRVEHLGGEPACDDPYVLEWGVE